MVKRPKLAGCILSSAVLLSACSTESGDDPIAVDDAGQGAGDNTLNQALPVGASVPGPSPQGIPDTGRDRSNRARGERESRSMLEGREVRTYDGSRNNVEQLEWGATFVNLRRLAASAYANSIDNLTGPQRQGARAISNAIADQAEGESIRNTVSGTDFIWQWGQFIDHDLDLTDGAEEDANIQVPEGDRYFDPAGTGEAEIAFSRALYDLDTGFDTANPRQQKNEVTAWLDGSMIYGSNVERAKALRVGPNSALLKTSSGNLLPFNTDALTNANGFIEDPGVLFLAGDVRVNEQLALATMHTLFVREHNRIALILQDELPAETADQIFEATRRLVIAKIQIITYDEWLPALLGTDAIPAYSGYDSTINPGIYNEFSAAAFRLGHSLINERLWRLDANGNEIDAGHIDLKNAFFTAPRVLVSQQSLDPILRGLATQAHQQLDTKIVSTLRNFLFGQPGSGGFDLASLNIQRGRDHGLPDYNSMRAAMGLSPVDSFDQISSDPETASALEASYSDVNDIDLWVGGLAEDAVNGSQLGALFQAIVVKQFTELRDGDRFWYQNDLTSDELNRVSGTTLAKVIRANTGVGDELQGNVFQVP